MASEISLTGTLSYVKSGDQIVGTASVTQDQTGATAINNIQAVGTSSEAISLGDVTVPGYVFFKNLDATNFVEVAVTSPCTSANAIIKLKPGEPALLPTRQTAFWALADTAPVNLLVIALTL